MNGYAIELLKTAIKMIERGEPEGAGWRIADAAGYLRQDFDKSGKHVMGLHSPTGLGNQVVDAFASESEG